MRREAPDAQTQVRASSKRSTWPRTSVPAGLLDDALGVGCGDLDEREPLQHPHVADRLAVERRRPR